MYDDFQIISANLKYLREKSGYTQEQLAEITGLSVSHISKVEAGLRRVGMKTYISILQALNVEGNDYINLAVKDSNENNIKQYLAIFEGCSEAETKFLLNSLESLKANLKQLNPHASIKKWRQAIFLFARKEKGDSICQDIHLYS